MEDDRSGHDKKPFRKFWGMEKVRIDRNGGGGFTYVRDLIRAYETCLKRPRSTDGPPGVDLCEGLKRRKRWWEEDGEEEYFRLLEESGGCIHEESATETAEREAAEDTSVTT